MVEREASRSDCSAMRSERHLSSSLRVNKILYIVYDSVIPYAEYAYNRS